jgi:hypothetical protein
MFANDEVALGEFAGYLPEGAIDGFRRAVEVVPIFRQRFFDAVVLVLEDARVAKTFPLLAVLRELPILGILCFVARREVVGVRGVPGQ